MISCSIVVFVCKANSAFSSVRRTHNSNRTPYKRDCKDNTFFSYLQIFFSKKCIFSYLFYKFHTFCQKIPHIPSKKFTCFRPEFSLAHPLPPPRNSSKNLPLCPRPSAINHHSSGLIHLPPIPFPLCALLHVKTLPFPHKITFL